MNTERLLTLADFIEKLKPEQFDFRYWISESTDGCGTVCCAVGWLPAVFPTDFKYTGVGIEIDVWGDVRSFFDIDGPMYNRLFYPGSTTGYLNADATPTQMAAHIRAVVAEQWYPQPKIVTYYV